MQHQLKSMYLFYHNISLILIVKTFNILQIYKLIIIQGINIRIDELKKAKKEFRKYHEIGNNISHASIIIKDHLIFIF